ncbi:MAG: hypothetical protein WCC10_12670 [Tumebacillaceae bacterium]
MKKPISVFIMDVTNSSQFVDMDMLSSYLDQIVDWIQVWTQGIVKTKAKHRFGDEIILVSDNFSTAFIIASHITRLWAYEGYEPYFGCSFGYSRNEVSDIDNIDTWNDPLVKIARRLLEQSKDKNSRTWMRMGSMDFDQQFIKLLNAESEKFALLRALQAKNQKVVSDLHFFYMWQNKVADILHKTPATVSSQLKKGRSEKVQEAYYNVEESLSYLQQFPEYSKEPRIITGDTEGRLKDSIRFHVMQHLNMFFPDVAKE